MTKHCGILFFLIFILLKRRALRAGRWTLNWKWCLNLQKIWKKPWVTAIIFSLYLIYFSLLSTSLAFFVSHFTVSYLSVVFSLRSIAEVEKVNKILFDENLSLILLIVLSVLPTTTLLGLISHLYLLYPHSTIIITIIDCLRDRSF